MENELSEHASYASLVSTIALPFLLVCCRFVNLGGLNPKPRNPLDANS